MVRVCVVGGGTAGSEAALEAGEKGADVTIIERLEAQAPPWATWPDLIGPTVETAGPTDALRRLPVPPGEILRAEAKAVGSGSVVTSVGPKSFESAIVATGSSFRGPVFTGSRKHGVIHLDSPDSYADLGVSAASSGGVVVVGEGFRGLQVAERLRGLCPKVHLVISEWQHELPSPSILGLLVDAVRSSGVVVSYGRIGKAVGVDALEAVLTDSEVIACSTLAVVPRRVPKVLPTPASSGRLGGLLVDRSMNTACPGVFAAGGCAELETGLAPAATLESEAAISGLIAGANCMGEEHRISTARFGETSAFGLRWCRVGLGCRGARARGLAVKAVDKCWGKSGACEILYEKKSQRVVGVELLAPTSSAPAVAVPISSGISLQALAYGGSSSSDISLISETARLGLREWRRS